MATKTPQQKIKELEEKLQKEKEAYAIEPLLVTAWDPILLKECGDYIEVTVTKIVRKVKRWDILLHTSDWWEYYICEWEYLLEKMEDGRTMLYNTIE